MTQQPQFPHAELEALAEIGASPARKARLRERAFFLAGVRAKQPSLAEALAAGVSRELDFQVYEPSLLAGYPPAFPPVQPWSTCLLPIDAFLSERTWDISGAGSMGASMEASMRAATEEDKETRLVCAETLRMSLHGTETDLLESAAWGFAGALMPVAGRDVFALQLLVELARDCRITLVPLVDSQRDFTTVLETDCPYVGFGTISSASPDGVLALFRMNRGRLPTGMSAIVFFSHGAQEALARVALGAGALAVITRLPHRPA